MAPPRQSFKLEVRVELQRVEIDEGAYERYTNDRLSVYEQKSLGDLSFADVAKVLERFYAVVEALEAELRP